MFDESLVVQSAVSAFNNAALVAPTFFWLGLLAAPLMALAYFYGKDFMKRIGWRDADLEKNTGILTVAVTLLWIVAFGGNYGVLRDATSALPFGMAAVVFVCMFVMGAVSRSVRLPAWRGASWHRRGMLAAAVAAVLFFVGASGMHTWWGVLMQVAAFVCGGIAGRYSGRTPRIIPAGLIIIGAVDVLMLMQPEFFRFGQLGALTVVHMAALLAIGGLVAAVAALRNVAPRGRIHRSAYVKLKWMARFLAALGVILFVLTESVPVFLGTLAVLFGMFALSVRHAEKIPHGLDVKLWALILMLFGLITTLPLLSALGVLVWISAPSCDVYSGSKFLL